MRPWLATLLLVFLRSAQGEPSILDQGRQLWLSGQAEKALTALAPAMDAKRPESERALAYVLKGTIHLRQNQPEEARQALEKSLVLKSNVQAYAFYLLGESYFKLKRFGDARSALERVGYFKPSNELKFQVRYMLADIAMSEQNWGEADRHLAFLARKWKHSPNYPEVLWRQLQTGLHRKNSAAVCKQARILYSRFPAHPLVYDWAMDLQNAQVEGHRLGCVASGKDQSARIKRLQLSGETDRARREINQLRGTGRPADVERAEMVMVDFLISDGYPDEALKTLVKYYPRHEKDVGFLLTLARAAARSGEFQTAVGAYLQVHELIPKRKLGREALFQAAFMSYQFQDYDGAMRRFARFIELYSKSGLARDARWHLAWVRYLRGDYAGAYDLLAPLRTKIVRRQVRHDDRATYWMAMALARMGRREEAKTLFASLEKPNPASFYALAARARLSQLPAMVASKVQLRQPASLPPVPATPAVNEANEEPTPNESEDNLSLEREETADPSAEASVEPQSEDEPKNEEEPKTEGGPVVDLDDDGPVDSDEDERLEVSEFKDPKLKRRFEVAQDLIALGFSDWARYEYYEVERRSRNPSYLKTLIHAYVGIESYHRALGIAENFFGTERLQGGYNGARDLWVSAYPKAYFNSVDRFSTQYSVPKEWVWAIMRAESRFRPDVLSPVGAKGLMQLMPETGRQVSKLLGDEGEFQAMSLLNPETNIRLGSRYLSRLSTKLKGSLPLVAAAYNAGPHRVENWLSQFGQIDMDEFIEHIPFLETRNYVKRVVSNFAVYRALFAFERKSLTWLASTVPVHPEGRPATRETWD